MNENGYVVYPSCTAKMDIEQARRLAAEESTLAENKYQSRVEDCDTQKTVAQFRDGQEV